MDTAYATIAELSAQLRQRKLSCVELVQETLDRTKKVDATLNSYITLLPDAALARAREIDRDISVGRAGAPLHGIPISLKDHIDTAGIPTTAGAKSRLHNVPTRDAVVARRMREAGTVLIGKANMNKFADGESGDNPDFGKIRNPWNTNYSPGGSSSGSGAMVAAGLVPLSVGSDNGGSIRIPAALCGVVGLKPTHGRVSLDGIFPRLYSLDHAGPLTRSVEDAAIALEALAGHDTGDGTTAQRPLGDYRGGLRTGIRGLRIGVDHGYVTVGQPAVLSAFAQSVEVLRGLGATIVDVTIPTSDQFGAVGNTISTCEYAVAAADLFRLHPEDFDKAVPPAASGADVKAGAIVPAVDYIRATQQRRVIQQAYAQATREVEVLVTPTYPLAGRPFGPYPQVQGKAFTADDAIRYTFPFDVLGVPAISVPGGFSPDGFPIGFQIAGRPFDEAMVLRVAAAYEGATEWHAKRPPLTT